MRKVVKDPFNLSIEKLLKLKQKYLKEKDEIDQVVLCGQDFFRTIIKYTHWKLRYRLQVLDEQIKKAMNTVR
jgi:hypothetical protein